MIQGAFAYVQTMMTFAQATGGVSLEGLAPIGGGAIAGTAMAWIMFRVFPAFMQHINKVNEDNQARIDRVIDESQKRDDARLRMYFEVAQKNREENERSRSDDRDNIQKAFLEFANSQGSEMKELTASVRELTKTISQQGVRT